MVTVKMVTTSRGDASSIDTDEHRVQTQMLPLRCHANQTTVEFLRDYFTSSEHAGDAAAAKDRPAAQEMFFQCFDARGFRLKIDYDTRTVDLKSLQEGNIVELLNLFPLEFRRVW